MSTEALRRIEEIKSEPIRLGDHRKAVDKLCAALKIAIKAMELRRVECGFVGETMAQIEEVLK